MSQIHMYLLLMIQYKQVKKNFYFLKNVDVYFKGGTLIECKSVMFGYKARQVSGFFLKKKKINKV